MKNWKSKVRMTKTMDKSNNGPPVYAVQPAPGVMMIFTEVCGVHINVAAVKVVDVTEYDPPNPERKITIKLSEGDEYIFQAEDADQANYWFLAFTGQAKVQPA